MSAVDLAAPPPAPAFPLQDSPTTQQPLSQQQQQQQQQQELSPAPATPSSPAPSTPQQQQQQPAALIVADAASHVPAISTPADPHSIPIDPPKGSPPPPVGQLLPDVAAAEGLAVSNGLLKPSTPPPTTPSPPAVQQESISAATPHSEIPVFDSVIGSGDDSFLNPTHFDHFTADVIMGDALNGAHIHLNGNGDLGHQDSQLLFPASPVPVPPYVPEDDADQPPPAKRQKLEPSPGLDLNTEMSIDAPTIQTPWSKPISPNQNKFALSIIRSLKKHKEAGPFNQPVDYIAMNIPHYPNIIHSPMDLSTVEKKLGGGGKGDAIYQRYQTVDEFVTDVRLVFQNCLTFNGPEHPVSIMGKHVEEHFDKLLKNMPTAEEIKPPPPRAVPKKHANPARRHSTLSGPPNLPRRDESYASQRPKREIPPPRDHVAEVAMARPAKARQAKRAPRNDGTVEQLKFCQKILTELFRKQYAHCAFPFYEPVDIVKLDIPHYPKIVKKPMDLGTMQAKLTAGEYYDAKAFHADFKLMIRNCFAFNPAGTPVHQAGVELNSIFDEKWEGLPPLRGEESEDEEEDESDGEHNSAVLLMEAQIQSLHSALASLKKKSTKKEKVHKHRAPQPQAIPSIPKPPKPNGKASSSVAPPKPKKKKAHEEEEALSFEQKKQLSESIQTLDGGRLERVLEIIDEVYPEIRETSEEIELDIDSLPSHVLIRLYNFVIRPNKPRVGRPPNGSSHSKNVVAGVKRKSMDEEVESERIRQLELTLERLKNGVATDADVAAANAATNGGVAGGEDSDSDADSSDSSGSDSE